MVTGHTYSPIIRLDYNDVELARYCPEYNPDDKWSRDTIRDLMLSDTRARIVEAVADNVAETADTDAKTVDVTRAYVADAIGRVKSGASRTSAWTDVAAEMSEGGITVESAYNAARDYATKTDMPEGVALNLIDQIYNDVDKNEEYEEYEFSDEDFAEYDPINAGLMGMQKNKAEHLADFRTFEKIAFGDKHTVYSMTEFADPNIIVSGQDTQSRKFIDDFNAKMLLFCSKNPVMKGKPRRKEYIAQFRNYVIEFDDIKPDTDIDAWVERQRTVRDLLSDVCSMAIFTGSKSIHFWVCVEGLSESQYKRYADAFIRFFDLHGLKPDISVIKDASKWVRIPGGKHNRTGGEQCLIYADESIIIDAARLDKWFADNGISLIDEQSQPGRVHVDTTSVLDIGDPSYWVNKAVAKVNEGEGRNDSGVWLACQLRDNGVDEADATGLMQQYQSAVEHAKLGEDDYTMYEAAASLKQAYGREPRDPAGNVEDDGNATAIREAMRETGTDVATAEALERVDPTTTVAVVEAVADVPTGYKDFPVDCLPPVLREFVEAQAANLECPAAMVATPLFPALAACIGNARQIRAYRRWREPFILWSCVISKRGSMKSPAFAEVMDYLWRYNAENKLVFNEAMKEYKKEHIRYEEYLKEWKKNKNLEPPEEPEKPNWSKIAVDDATAEALMLILDKNPRGVLSARDELSEMFANMNMYRGGKGGDSEKWLRYWSAQTAQRNRASKPEEDVIIRRASVSVAGTTQPEIIAEIMRGKNSFNGMLSRFLLTMPPPTPPSPDDFDPPDISVGILERMEGLYKTLLGLMDGVDASNPLCVEVDTDAWTVLRAWVKEVKRLTYYSEGNDDVDGALAKLKGMVPRIAGVLQLAEDPTALTIGKRVMENALTICRWYLNEAKRVFFAFTLIREGVDSRPQGKVASLLNSHGGRLPLGDLGRRLHLEKDKNARDKLIASCVKQGIVRVVEEKNKRGRVTQYVCLVGTDDDSLDDLEDVL